MSSFSSPLVFFFVDVFFEAFFVLCWKILFATKSLWCVKKEQLFCSFARRFFLETTLMGVLFFFWDALFCFFAQQNVAILPKKLRFTRLSFFFWSKYQRLFYFLFCEKEERLFWQRLTFLNKGCCLRKKLVGHDFDFTKVVFSTSFFQKSGNMFV